jgi:hypothetical protein
VRAIRDQCQKAGVRFFFKQWGGVRKHRTGRTLDGQTWDEMPNQVGTSSPRRARPPAPHRGRVHRLRSPARHGAGPAPIRVRRPVTRGRTCAPRAEAPARSPGGGPRSRASSRRASRARRRPHRERCARHARRERGNRAWRAPGREATRGPVGGASTVRRARSAGREADGTDRCRPATRLGSAAPARPPPPGCRRVGSKAPVPRTGRVR